MIAQTLSLSFYPKLILGLPHYSLFYQIFLQIISFAPPPHQRKIEIKLLIWCVTVSKLHLQVSGTKPKAQGTMWIDNGGGRKETGGVTEGRKEAGGWWREGSWCDGGKEGSRRCDGGKEGSWCDEGKEGSWRLTEGSSSSPKQLALPITLTVLTGREGAAYHIGWRSCTFERGSL